MPRHGTNRSTTDGWSVPRRESADKMADVRSLPRTDSVFGVNLRVESELCRGKGLVNDGWVGISFTVPALVQ
jgi:hypothetical protein